MRCSARLSVLLTAVVVAGLVPVVAPAHAGDAPPPPPPAAHHEVLAGFFDKDANKPYEYTKYYPSALEVNSGETIRWENRGFHTVTFLPGGVGNSRAPLWRSDEAPGALAANEPVFGFDGTACGAAALDEEANAWRAQPPCEVAGTGSSVHSTPVGTFRATITAPSGTELTYFCAIHNGMKGTIRVVSGPPNNPTPGQVAAEIAADTAAADALRGYNNTLTDAIGNEGGRPVYLVKAGDRTAGNAVQILDFMPNDLTVPANAIVRYEVLGDEIHTVTFPKESEGGFVAPFGNNGPGFGFGLGGLAFNPACDLDGRTSGAPGIRYGPCLTPLAGMGPLEGRLGEFELLLSPWMTSAQRAPSDNVRTPATLHNSGFLVSTTAPEWFAGAPAGSGKSFPTSFPSSFPNPGQFTYYCALHFSSPDIPVVGDPFPGMQGSITVTG